MEPIFDHEQLDVYGLDVAAQLGRITVPPQITFGRHDMVTSTRFADQITGAIRGSELLIFEECAHAPI
jgi:pimeloyl-ACP methyl ester carboxylesterase